MSKSTHEALVILHHDVPVSIGDMVRPYAILTQAVSNRIGIISADAANLEQVQGLDAVELLLTGSVPLRDIPELSEQETLFVTAWMSQQGVQQKKRSGEGLDWDTPGFTPPDR